MIVYVVDLFLFAYYIKHKYAIVICILCPFGFDLELGDSSTNSSLDLSMRSMGIDIRFCTRHDVVHIHFFNCRLH